jgi:hypothetical protein
MPEDTQRCTGTVPETQRRCTKEAVMVWTSQRVDHYLCEDHIKLVKQVVPHPKLADLR